MIKFIQPEFIHEDDRGCLKQLVSKGWSQVNFISSNRAAIRGHHYHKENSELFFVISGSFKLILEKDNLKQDLIIKTNDMFIIEPKTMHAFEFLEDTLLVSMYDLGVEVKEELDIYRS